MEIPRISIAVVTNGPVEIAGSIFNFSSRIGTKDPKQTEITMEKHTEIPTTTPRLNDMPVSIYLKNARNPKNNP